MDPSKQFDWCLQRLRIFFHFAGQDILAGNAHRSTGFYVQFCAWISIISSALYTAIYFDSLIAFKVLIALFGATQIFIKFLFMRDLQMLVEITEFTKSIFQTNSNITARDNDLCIKHSNWNRMIVKMLPIIYLVIPLAYEMPTYAHLVLTGELEPAYGMYLPGLDMEQWANRLITFLFNVMCNFVTYPILTAFDTFIYVTFNNMTMISKVITNDIDELGKMLTDKLITEKRIKFKLIGIIQMHVDYNAKIKLLDQGFQRACSLQIATEILMATICVFLLFSTDFIEVYAAVVLGISQILACCILGTIIEISSSRIADAETSLDWHLLPQDQRKIYLFFLHYAQQPQVLYIAKIAPLNMETSLKILKSIFSYAAVLRSTMNY